MQNYVFNYKNNAAQKFHKSNNSNDIHLLVAHAEKSEPRRFKFNTGLVIKELAKTSEGLSKNQLLILFCPTYHSASLVKRESLRMSVEKIIQRTRHIFKMYNLKIVFDKKSKKYVLTSVQ